MPSNKTYFQEYYQRNKERIRADAKARTSDPKYKAAKAEYDRKRREKLGDELREYDRVRSKKLACRTRQLIERAKRRAKESGVVCTLRAGDVVIPETCPILGIRLRWTDRQGGCPESPSLDRLVPEDGYIPGNVHVISLRANRMKWDATVDDVRKLLEWMEKAHEVKRTALEQAPLGAAP
jgi:hypothetical protein